MTIGEWRHSTSLNLRELLGCNPDVALLETDALLEIYTKMSRAQLIARKEQTLDKKCEKDLKNLLDRRIQGCPLAYIRGSVEFYGMKFEICKEVLIPRPETEMLVDHALKWIKERDDCVRIIDVGTGSGCIAVSIAAMSRGRNVEIFATDISSSALKVAKKNALKIAGGVEKIRFMHCNFVDDFSCDLVPMNCLVVSNPPYLTSKECKELAVGRYEPRIALDGGISGMESTEELITSVSNLPFASSIDLALEIACSQKNSVENILKYSGFQKINTHLDPFGLPRIVTASLRACGKTGPLMQTSKTYVQA